MGNDARMWRYDLEDFLKEVREWISSRIVSEGDAG